MNLEEALHISGIPLEEATLSQIVKRINKHRAMSRSPEELARMLKADNAFKSSVPTVQAASAEEKKEYGEMMRDGVIRAAIDVLPDPIKNHINRFGELASDAVEKAGKKTTQLKVRGTGPLANMSKEEQDVIQQMQLDFIKAKTPKEKEAMIQKWTDSTVNAKLYKLALKTGII